MPPPDCLLNPWIIRAGVQAGASDAPQNDSHNSTNARPPQQTHRLGCKCRASAQARAAPIITPSATADNPAAIPAPGHPPNPLPEPCQTPASPTRRPIAQPAASPSAGHHSTPAPGADAKAPRCATPPPAPPKPCQPRAGPSAKRHPGHRRPACKPPQPMSHPQTAPPTTEQPQ